MSPKTSSQLFFKKVKSFNITKRNEKKVRNYRFNAFFKLEFTKKFPYLVPEITLPYIA